MSFKILVAFMLLLIVSCTFSKKIKDGESAFERKQYAVAIPLLENEYKDSRTEADKGRKAFLLGQSFQKMQAYPQAASWFESSIKHNYGHEALGKYAYLCKILENYQTALNIYQKLGNDTGRKLEFDREVLVCKQAIQKKMQPSEYKTEVLFENSPVSDYSPALYENDFIVFTSERTEATGKETYKWTGQKFSDIFIIRKDGSDIKKFDSAINTNQNEGNPWFSKNMETMYFTRCYAFSNGDERCKIMVSKRINEVWEEPQVLPFVQDKYSYGHPTLIENDSVLVFASDISEPGGAMDLYYTELQDDGNWSEPEKLPSSINTQGNEKFPTGDGDTLYFSSDFLPGFGGYDIFKTYLRKDFSWAPPNNLGYGINSGGDDFSFIVDYKEPKKPGIIQQGYFTSSKPGSKKDDIYRFYKQTPEKIDAPEVVTTAEPKMVVKSLFVLARTYTPQFLMSDDPNSELIGKNQLATVAITIFDENNVKIAEGYSDGKGLYYHVVPENKVLKVVGSKLNYLTASTFVDTRNVVFKEDENTKTLNVELNLEKIYRNKEINLKNIYYDYDKWDIKEEAKPTLDQLFGILKDNPRIQIQLSSHTDCRGTEAYNVELSQKRAQSVVDYLVAKGIDSKRITPIGYGESSLIETCECEKCTENQHQINRRTTFKIIN
jgi:outer membrane protein OmpA-like peptidoglycan-associated protein